MVFRFRWDSSARADGYAEGVTSEYASEWYVQYLRSEVWKKRRAAALATLVVDDVDRVWFHGGAGAAGGRVDGPDATTQQFAELSATTSGVTTLSAIYLCVQP